MLKELNYKVNGQTLIGESFKMASDTVNEIKVSFAFEGTDWSGLDSIKAVFSSNRIGNSYEVVLTNGSCIIPHEVLAEKGTVSVNLYGSIISGTTLTTRITSYKSACVDVLQKVNVSGSNSVVPTPATWEQELSAHTQNTTVHVTAQNKADWNAKLSDAPSDSKTYGRKNGQWSEVEGGGGSSVWGQITGTLSNQTDLNTALGLKANASDVYTKTESNNRFALATAILDMATKTWVNAQGFITSLAGYATEAWVTAKGYATQSWVTAKGYATQSWVNAKNYATQSWVEAKGYLTEHQSLSAYRKSADQDTIDSGKVDKVAGKGLSTNDYTNTDKQKVANAITEHQSLANYYTKSEVDTEIAGHHDATKQDKYSSVLIAISVGDWSSKTAVKSVSGVTASNDVDIIVSPSDLDKWAMCGVKCTAQGSETLTFTCVVVPDTALTLNVRIWG